MIRLCSRFDSVLFTPKIAEIPSHGNYSRSPILEQRLISLHPATAHRLKARRPYPPVFPKFANPDEPSQVWAGRGKKPQWVLEKLASGLALEDLRIGRGRIRR
jgi:DNA-binding protein H-NS